MIGKIFRYCFPATLLATFLGLADADDLSNSIGDVFRDCDVCPKMVVIEKGTFKMGSPPSAAGRPTLEGSVRRVEISRAFALGVYEITQQNWQSCVFSKKCDVIEYDKRGGDHFPIANVSWIQAVQYVEWLSDKTKFDYRLPTEAEWEYAARAGSDRSRFFGLREGNVCHYGNVYDQSAYGELGYDWEYVPCSDGYVQAAPVGSFLPNKFGLFDMLGNVWEWTEDCASATSRGIRTDSEAIMKGDCSQRAFRGGSWLSQPPRYLRFSDRYKYVKVQESDLGFRVARELF